MGVDGSAHRRPHLRTARAPALRIELDHPGLDDHATCAEAAGGILLPASVPTLPRQCGSDLRTAAARVEPACPSSFRPWSVSYPARIAACPADRDFDLLEERLRPRIDPCSSAARPTRLDSKIFALIPCHDATIDAGTSPYKSCRSSIASDRSHAHHGEQKGQSLSTQVARAIASKIETKEEKFSGGGGRPCAAPSRGEKTNVQTTLCDPRERRTRVRFILHC